MVYMRFLRPGTGDLPQPRSTGEWEDEYRLSSSRAHCHWQLELRNFVHVVPKESVARLAAPLELKAAE